MQEVKVKDFFWKTKHNKILQVRIQYAEGYIHVFDSNGKRILKWTGLTREEIRRIEAPFMERRV